MQKFSHNSSPVFNTIGQSSPELLLQNLLPTDLKLERNMEDRMLSLLSTEYPCIIAQQRFTKNEWSLLMHLLDYYPHYVPHEILLAELTLLSPDDCRRLLQKARLQGVNVVVQELKPVYRALSSTRVKLKKLHAILNISHIRNAGYALILTPESNRL